MVRKAKDLLEVCRNMMFLIFGTHAAAAENALDGCVTLSNHFGTVLYHYFGMVTEKLYGTSTRNFMEVVLTAK